LSAFPKLIASELAGAGAGASSKQHTFVETENVRYVYLPLEGSLFLLLVTNKGSNIVEDLDTLRLISRVLPEQLGVGVALNEDTVAAKAFELLFALDEVVASGGYREEITLHQVRVNLEMESHEEKLAEMIKASKMAEAKEAAKRKANEIREKTREDEKTRSRETAAGGGPTCVWRGRKRRGCARARAGCTEKTYLPPPPLYPRASLSQTQALLWF
jgi:hypothetical protein